MSRKGEKVSILRRIDANWLEGYMGKREGIFPVLYVEIIKEPVENCKYIYINRENIIKLLPCKSWFKWTYSRKQRIYYSNNKTITK